MELFCCLKCYKNTNCVTKWIRGTQDKPQLCCSECQFYLRCKGIETVKGIDIGTTFVKCAQKINDGIVFKSQRNAFFEIEHNNFTRRILEKAEIRYILKDDKLYIVGQEPLEFANMLKKETRRPLSKGIISSKEKEAIVMIEILIKNIVGESSYPGETIYYSVPGEPVDADLNIIYHEKLLAGFLSALGYSPKAINEGYAVILSELAGEDFTGLGLSFGGGMVNVCFSFMSVPVFKFSVTKAGDWIDQQVAMAVDETAGRITAIKEYSFDLEDKDNPSKIENALSVYYDHLIEYVIENIKQQFSRHEKIPLISKPVTIILSGGTSLPKGFAARFKQILGQLKLPIPVGEVKMAIQPFKSVVKGALVAASAEER